MRIAIISDIHGNKMALDAVLADLAQQPGIDQIVIAGDICLNGPYPYEVLQTIKALKCPVIQGNVDADVANDAEEAGPKKRSIIAWTRAQLGRKGIDYLASLPFSYLVSNPYGSDLLVVHANPLDQEEAILPVSPDNRLEALLGKLDPRIGAVAFGHYHVAYTRHWRHLLLVDAGSAGVPRDEDLRASYAILTYEKRMWHAQHRRIEYDVDAVVEQLRTCGIPHAEKRIRILTEATYVENSIALRTGKRKKKA